MHVNVIIYVYRVGSHVSYPCHSLHGGCIKYIFIILIPSFHKKYTLTYIGGVYFLLVKTDNPLLKNARLCAKIRNQDRENIKS